MLYVHFHRFRCESMCLICEPQCAVERRIPILHPSWITDSYETWLRGDDVDLESVRLLRFAALTEHVLTNDRALLRTNCPYSKMLSFVCVLPLLHLKVRRKRRRNLNASPKLPTSSNPTEAHSFRSSSDQSRSRTCSALHPHLRRQHLPLHQPQIQSLPTLKNSTRLGKHPFLLCGRRGSGIAWGMEGVAKRWSMMLPRNRQQRALRRAQAQRGREKQMQWTGLGQHPCEKAREVKI